MLITHPNLRFMWVRLQIDYLQRLPNDIEKRKALRHLPPDLPQTYIRILETIDSSYPAQTTKYIRRLLHWLVLSVQIAKGYTLLTFNYPQPPSTLATLCQVICIENEHDWPSAEIFPTPELIYRWLGCLVPKSKDGSTIRLSHFTIREFLTMDQKTIASSKVHKYLVNSDDEFSKICFRCLTHDRFRDTVLYNEEQVQSFLTEDSIYEEVARQVYNILYMFDDDNNDPELERLIQRFLSPTHNTLFDLWATCSFQLVREHNDRYHPYIDPPRDISPKLSSPLHLACFAGLANHVDRLLKEGVDPNSSNNLPGPNLTPLHFAISEGNLSFTDCVTGVFQLDLRWDNDPDRHQAQGMRVSSLLVASGANIEQQLAIHIIWEEGRAEFYAILTPLMLAVVFRKHQLGSLLLRNGADWNAVANLSLEGYSDLCSVGNLLTRIPCLENTVQLIVDNTGHCGLKEALEGWRVSQNTIREMNSQILFVEAFRRKDWNTVEELLETDSDVDINYIDDQGENALWSASLGPTLTLRCLLEHGANPNASLPSGTLALCCAVSQSRIENMKLLLEFGADIECRDPDGWTPLHLAVYYRHYDALEFLLNSGADANATLNHGSNALLVKGGLEDGAILTLLLSRGIDPNAPNHYGELALHVACAAGLEAQTDRLCSLATDTFKNINQHDINYGTPLYLATRKGHEHIVKLLLERGASIDKTGPGNVLGSALMVACAEGHTAIVKLLLSRGASLEVEGSRFSSAQGTARAFRQDAILNILEEHSRGNELQNHDQISDRIHEERSKKEEDEEELDGYLKILVSA